MTVEQLTLDALYAPVSPHRKARATDPATAKRAAVEAFPRQGNQRHRILEAVAGAPDGLTYEQVAEVTGVLLVSVSTRIKELLDGGWLASDEERLTTSGQPAKVYRLTPAAAVFLAHDG